MQRDIKSNKINLIPFNCVLTDENGKAIYDDENKCYKYKYTTFDDVLKDCPNFNYDGKEYWFLNSSIYKSKTITEYQNNYLVTKINNEYNIIGYISLSFRGKIPGEITKYSINEILILPKFRRKGYSFIMNKFVQEKTGLNYSTDGFKSKLGHYQMIKNKRLLKYESFNK